MAPARPTSKQSLTLDAPPSCVAFYPVDFVGSKNRTCFVVGTYSLHKEDQGTSGEAHDPGEAGKDNDDASLKPQRRSGSLQLFSLSADGEITHHHTTPLPHASVLHLTFPSSRLLPPGSAPVFAAALSTGQIDFYTLSPPRLTHTATFRVTTPDTLVLHCAFHPTNMRLELVFTCSDGRVGVLGGPMEKLWHGGEAGNGGRVRWVGAHGLEAWVAGFWAEGGGTKGLKGAGVVSGGDDGVVQMCGGRGAGGFKGVVEEGEGGEGEGGEGEGGSEGVGGGMPEPVWADRKMHQAGVTAVLPLGEGLLVTGSYDDFVRLLRVPEGLAAGRREVLAELNLEGGVWRLNVIEQGEGGWLVLASCMHAGARVLRLKEKKGGDGEGKWEFEVLAVFEEHRSMNYGSDVEPVYGRKRGVLGGTRRIISTSFYDKLLCLWEVDLGELRTEDGSGGGGGGGGE